MSPSGNVPCPAIVCPSASGSRKPSERPPAHFVIRCRLDGAAFPILQRVPRAGMKPRGAIYRITLTTHGAEFLVACNRAHRNTFTNHTRENLPEQEEGLEGVCTGRLNTKFDTSRPNQLLEQTRISILNWNRGPRRGTPGTIETHIAGKWHIIALQDATEYLRHENLTNRFQISHYAGCAVLFNKDSSTQTCG